MTKFILWALVIVVVYGLGYAAYLFGLLVMQIRQNRKFQNSEPTLEEQLERYYQLAKQTKGRPGRISLPKHPETKQQTSTPSHLEQFSKAENLTIAWEKEGDKFQETFFQKS